MTGYIVTYEDENGEATSSQVVKRFDSLSELSAKTIALELLNKGCSDIKICEVEYTPIYEVQNAPPGIGSLCRMKRIS